jgi:hypothetical protein
MNLDHFLDFFTKNLQTIIEVNIIVIVIFTMLLLFVLVRRSKTDEEGQFSKIEEALKKVLDNTRAPRTLNELPDLATQAKKDEVELPPELAERLMQDEEPSAASKNSTVTAMAAAPSATAPTAVSAAASGDMEALKKSLNDKQLQIENLTKSIREAEAKAQAATTSAAATSPAADPGLQNKIKELESKLAEYEIIEDDIADLSLYKQENTRLKQELENLRSKGGDSGGDSGKSANGENLMKEFEEAVADQKGQQKPADPVMAEFEAAVAEQKAEKKSSTADEVSEVLSDDIMKQFAAAVSGEEIVSANAIATPIVDVNAGPDEDAHTPGALDSEGHAIDTDKMMNEIGDLEQHSASEVKSDEVLEKDIDTEKMASEATGLHVEKS